MRLFTKINLCLTGIMLICFFIAIIRFIKMEIDYKKDVRKFKEEILLMHNFDKIEIHILLDY